MGVGSGWYYNTISGDVVHASWFTSIGEGLVPSWHGPYATEAAAIAHKGIVGAPAKGNESVAQSVTGSASNLTGINAIGSFFNRLTQASTWERVGLAVAGLILLDVGLKSFTGTSVTEQAFKRTPPGRIAGVLK